MVMELDENSLKLMKKCEDKEIATQGMGACQVMLKEMEKGDIDKEFMEYLRGEEKDASYIEMAQKIAPEDVPKVLRMALKMKERSGVSPELKNAANRLIRAIEAF
ncbi:hypothetical protein [Methanobacterium oryzae]|uniref:hypothetical protein n=1 Tax=Methanobacterium oryzae TaxID=69540 RepID=UPI003D225D2F